MAKNRKSQSAELRFGPALKALLICFFIGGAGIGYVYQKNLLNQLGEEKKQREQELNRLRLHNDAQERQLSQLNSQGTLAQRVAELGLSLQLPSPSQIVVVVDEPLPPVVSARIARAEDQPRPVRQQVGEANR